MIIIHPLHVEAKDSLTIPEWVIEANLLENGDLQITEELTYDFNDSFNGVFREVVLKDTDGIADIKVHEISKDTQMEYTLVESAKKGDSGVFIIDENRDSSIIQIFSPSKDQKKTFRLSYTILNVAIRYNDTGELYYKFLGDENKTPIGSFQVSIALPQADRSDQVRVFAHGPLNGKIYKESETTYTMKVNDIPEETFIEGRLLFPKEFIQASTNTRDIDSYESILEEENQFQQRQTRDRERREAISNVLEKLSLGGSGIGLVLFLVFLYLFRRNEYVELIDQTSSIPEDCTPAVASYLVGSMVSTNTIFATILDLYRKGYLTIREEKDKERYNPNEQNFTIVKEREEDSDLSSHECYFINWLINEIGNGEAVTTKDIEYFNKHNSSKSASLFSGWKGRIKKEAVSRGYYDKSKYKFGAFFLAIAITLFAISIFTMISGSYLGIIGFVTSIILLIYSVTLFYWKSEHGYLQYRKWIAFKKYMKKYRIDLENEGITQDISLIYALGLGIINRIEENDLNQAMAGGNLAFYSWFYWYFMFINDDSSAFHSSLNSSFGAVSGSESAGSFSSGGGGGAGGGGAGGF